MYVFNGIFEEGNRDFGLFILTRFHKKTLRKKHVNRKMIKMQ